MYRCIHIDKTTTNKTRKCQLYRKTYLYLILPWKKGRGNISVKIPSLSKMFHTISFPFSFSYQHLPLLLHITLLLMIPSHCYTSQHFRTISEFRPQAQSMKHGRIYWFVSYPTYCISSPNFFFFFFLATYDSKINFVNK